MDPTCDVFYAPQWRGGGIMEWDAFSFSGAIEVLVSTLFLGFKVSSETAMMVLNFIVTLKSSSLPLKKRTALAICSLKQWSLSKTL